MKVTYYDYFGPNVNLHSIVDDFGNETSLSDYHVNSITKRYNMLNQAKIYFTGMTFEQANLSSILPTNEEH